MAAVLHGDRPNCYLSRMDRHSGTAARGLWHFMTRELVRFWKA